MVGYAAYNKLVRKDGGNDGVTLAGCWSRCKCASSKSGPARTTTSPITNSITALVPNGPLAVSSTGRRGETLWPFRTSPRQPNSCDGCMPMRCAIAETLAPGSKASATARALNSSDQRRRNCRGAPSSRSGTASIIWKFLVPELGADIEAHSSWCRLSALPETP